jgi:hypothetical protein
LTDIIQANDDPTSTAIAYQIAFDLYDNGTQEFLAKVIKSLPAKVEEAPTEKENGEYICICWYEIQADEYY